MLLNDPTFAVLFKRTIKTVAPYADSIVCIGGCANALYRYHPLASKPWPTYLGTMDMDWALPQRLEVPKKTEPLSKLMTRADFVEEKFGGTDNPVIKYRLGGDLSPTINGAEVEFLCPLSGLKGSRGSFAPASAQIQTGLYAQPLRYLELLLFRPWQVNMNDIAGLEEVSGLHVRIPNPVSYVMQKVLIRKDRNLQSMAKDCYYIYEVSILFRQAMNCLHDEFQAIMGQFPDKWSRDFRSSLSKLFANETLEGATSAVRVHGSITSSMNGSTRLTPKMVSQSVQKLIEAVG